MSDLLFFVITILVIFQIVISIWNYKSFKELSGKSPIKNEQLNDAKYYELKSKHEFTIATISIITTAVAFLGYNSIKGLQDSLKTDYQTKVQSTEKKLSDAENKINSMAGGIDQKFRQIDTSMISFKNLLQYFESQQSDLSRKANKTNGELNLAQEKINLINRKNVLKQNFYIVENIPFDLSVIEDSLENNDWKRVYFKDLKTIMGDILPEFKKKPFIISGVSNEGSSLTIRNVTTLYFEMSSYEYIISESSPNQNAKNRIQYYNMIISEIPE